MDNEALRTLLELVDRLVLAEERPEDISVRDNLLIFTSVDSLRLLTYGPMKDILTDSIFYRCWAVTLYEYKYNSGQ